MVQGDRGAGELHIQQPAFVAHGGDDAGRAWQDMGFAQANFPPDDHAVRSLKAGAVLRQIVRCGPQPGHKLRPGRAALDAAAQRIGKIFSFRHHEDHGRFSLGMESKRALTYRIFKSSLFTSAR